MFRIAVLSCIYCAIRLGHAIRGKADESLEAAEDDVAKTSGPEGAEAANMRPRMNAGDLEDFEAEVAPMHSASGAVIGVDQNATPSGRRGTASKPWVLNKDPAGEIVASDTGEILCGVADTVEVDSKSVDPYDGPTENTPLLVRNDNDEDKNLCDLPIVAMEAIGIGEKGSPGQQSGHWELCATYQNEKKELKQIRLSRNGPNDVVHFNPPYACTEKIGPKETPYTTVGWVNCESGVPIGDMWWKKEEEPKDFVPRGELTVFDVVTALRDFRKGKPYFSKFENNCQSLVVGIWKKLMNSDDDKK